MGPEIQEEGLTLLLFLYQKYISFFTLDLCIS